KEAKMLEIQRAYSDGHHWRNETYHVIVRSLGIGPLGHGWHLSIKRHDREPVSDWRDKQEIKNQLCGRECEGCEMYPAESRVVETSNQFHLWVFEQQIPIGF